VVVVTETYLNEFSEPWETCNNCKQPFQNQLSIDLASAFVSFAEATFGQEANSKWDKMKAAKVMTALRSKILTMSRVLSNEVHSEIEMQFTDSTNEIVKVEMMSIVNNLLSMVAQIKKDLNMNSWVHMPRASGEYQYYKMLSGNYEAFGYVQMGTLLAFFSSTSAISNIEGYKTAIPHFKKARAIYNLIGMKDEASQMDIKISLASKVIQSVNNPALIYSESSTEVSSISEITRITYENNMKTSGMNSEVTILSGLNYARALTTLTRTIEAQRLATKLSAVSRRVHGPDHKITITTDEILKECKERHVFVLPDTNRFHALRYVNDGEICVVQGPVTEPRITADERIHHIANNLVIPSKGCVVICHGLVSASHLNGGLGDVKENETGIRLAVHFEKKGAKSALVKPENLRIAFEIP
jgi:hypothetical protein